MFEVVIFTVALVLVAGSAAAMHGLVRLGYPPAPPSPELMRLVESRAAWLEMVRKRKRQRKAMHRELEWALQKTRRRE